MHRTSDDSRESDELRLAPVREGESVANNTSPARYSASAAGAS
jgi:hypothetical protein